MADRRNKEFSQLNFDVFDIVFGHYRANDDTLNYQIAKLNKDMISLAETPRVVQITGDMDVLGGNDKPNIHKSFDSWIYSYMFVFSTKTINYSTAAV